MFETEAFTLADPGKATFPGDQPFPEHRWPCREEGFFPRPALHQELGQWQLEQEESGQPPAPDHIDHQVLPLCPSLPLTMAESVRVACWGI